MSFHVPATAPDNPFSIGLPKVVDAEGSEVPGITVISSGLVSDNPAAVSVIPDPAGDPLAGSLHFELPGTATLSVSFSAQNADGSPVLDDTGAPLTATIAEVFIITSGPADAFSGGSLSFPGLTPDPVPPTP